MPSNDVNFIDVRFRDPEVTKVKEIVDLTETSNNKLSAETTIEEAKPPVEQKTKNLKRKTNVFRNTKLELQPVRYNLRSRVAK